jgi:hypothetical protein
VLAVSTQLSQFYQVLDADLIVPPISRTAGTDKMPGGVCQVLDYEVEAMAEYISEMATRVVMPRSSVTGAFRKFVSQILTSTRLPSTTILLGMNYLAKRVNMMKAAGQTLTNEGQVWRMLTIALLLGSKFLDDNTFQNKSWSEVSGISVQELNSLEYQWLSSINWCLYVNLDASDDYKAWLKNWEEWQESKKRQQVLANRERLMSLVTPIDTEVVRSRSQHVTSTWHEQQVAEYERLSNLKRNPYGQEQSYISREATWLPYQPAWQSAPLTPPDSGYGTPEYPDSAVANAQYQDWFTRAAANGPVVERHFTQPAAFNAYNSQPQAARNTQPTYTPYYSYGQSTWDPSVADCHCSKCASAGHNQHLPFMGNAYGQTVMG